MFKMNEVSNKVAYNGFGLGEGGDLPLMLRRRTKLSVTTKLSAEHETPPIANVMLVAGFLLSTE
jgi:hypothetical protein